MSQQALLKNLLNDLKANLAIAECNTARMTQFPDAPNKIKVAIGTASDNSQLPFAQTVHQAQSITINFRYPLLLKTGTENFGQKNTPGGQTTRGILQ